MTVRVNKSSFNIREKLSELGRKFGLKGSELVAAETVQEARDVVSAGRRNLVFNGDQRIDQRNNGSAVATSSSFPVDRFTISHSSNGAFSAQRSTEAPIGFQYSTKFTTTTADTSLTGSQRCLYFTKIEGQNAQHLEFGTTNAKPVTLSFWVRSSVTGTFSGSLQNGAQNRSYPYNYTINTADTWEYKTITIPGDVTGTWATDNTKSHQIFWSLGMSSDYAAPVNAWVAAQRWGSTTGTAGIMGTLNATWYITGVQLEVGRNATDFEYRSYGEELALCQRYYQKKRIGYGRVAHFRTDTILVFAADLPVGLRASAGSITQNNGLNNWAYRDGVSPTISSIQSNNSSASETTLTVLYSVSSGGDSDETCFYYGGGSILIDAEL